MLKQFNIKLTSLILIIIMVLFAILQAIPVFAISEAPVVDASKVIVIDTKTGAELYSIGGKEAISASLQLRFKSILLAETLDKENKAVTSDKSNKANVADKNIDKKLSQKITAVVTTDTLAKTFSKAMDNSKFIDKIKNIDEKNITSKKGITFTKVASGKAGEFYTLMIGKKGTSEFGVITIGGATLSGNEDDSMALMEYGFENYRTYQVLSKGKSVGKIKIKGGKASYAKVYAKEDMFVTLPKEGADSLVETKLNIKEDIKAPQDAGKVIGTVEAIEAGEVTGSVPAIIKDTIEVGGPWSKIGISDHMLYIIAAVVFVFLVLLIVVKMKKRKKRKRIEEMKRKRREEEAMRIAMERAEREKRGWYV